MTTAPISEKRRHQRFPVGVSLDVAAVGHPAGKCRATISDLSQTGLTLKTDAVLEQGMHLFLRLAQAGQFRGEVRHVKDSDSAGLRRYGVRLHKIDFAHSSQSQEKHQP